MTQALEGLSDDELRRELRLHLQEGDWTVGHWRELERRDEDLLESDSDLQSAMSTQRARMLRNINHDLEPFGQQLVADFRAFSEQLPRIETGFEFPELPRFELELPHFDLSRFFPSRLASSLSGKVLDSEATIDVLVEAQEDLWQREAERRRAKLKAAEATVRQLALLEEMEQANRQRHQGLTAGQEKLRVAVHSSAQPKWMMWAMLTLAGIAALASAVALF